MDKTVLIVEDSKLLRTVVKDALENAGFKTIEAENGQDALAQAYLKHPDLIMLDVMMPVMDGLTMFAKLREDSWGKSVPVIMLTGAEEERVMSWIMNEGLSYFKKDGWMMDEVVDSVKKKLGMK